MVRQAVSTWPESLRVAILASGSLALDIGGPFAPHGRIAAWPIRRGPTKCSAHSDRAPLLVEKLMAHGDGFAAWGWD
ncbi:MAG: hypothetical protein JO020_05345 [Chloroflexi bacterium]|nr:hypothetical protein [Chloroflexota bacterium]